MKKLSFAIVLLVVASTTFGADLLVSGKWMDTGNDSLLNDGIGGEVQARIPIPMNLTLGLSVGYDRYNVSPTSESCGNRFMGYSTSTKGMIENMPLSISLIKGLNIGGCTIEAEGGARYNLILDSDVYTTETVRVGSFIKPSTVSEEDLKDYWSAFAGANLVVPLGAVKGLIGGGYDWQMEHRHTRTTQGWYAKAGLIIPLL